MKLPKRIKICSVWYKVLRSDMKKNWGKCDLDIFTITFAKKFPSEYLFARTVIHEISHVISREFNLNFDAASCIKISTDEDVADANERGWASLMQDNPELCHRLVDVLSQNKGV